MEVKITKTNGWELVVDCARWTVNKPPINREPSDKFKKSMVLSEHSPLRELRFHVEMKRIPNFSSQQISRHDCFTGHSHRDASKDQNYVATSRSDRTDKKDEEVTRLTPIDHKISLSAQDFIELSKKRLCSVASTETRKAWKEVIKELSLIEPILASACQPTCIYRGFCPEEKPCGYASSDKFMEDRYEYMTKLKY